METALGIVSGIFFTLLVRWLWVSRPMSPLRYVVIVQGVPVAVFDTQYTAETWVKEEREKMRKQDASERRYWEVYELISGRSSCARVVADFKMRED